MSAKKTERLMNLLILLLSSRAYLPKHVLRDSLAEYRNAPSDEAFEKMFERDKDELRALGVPVEMGSFDPLFLYHAGIVSKRSGDEDRARRLLGELLGQSPRFSPLFGPRAEAAFQALR